MTGILSPDRSRYTPHPDTFHVAEITYIVEPPIMNSPNSEKVSIIQRFHCNPTDDCCTTAGETAKEADSE